MINYQPPVNTGLDIIYLDEYLIVLNKPSGLLSVPGRGIDKQDCLAARVAADYPSALITHRLDMSTSGIIVLALNKAIHRQISNLFATRQIFKKYIAIVNGIFELVEGEVNQALICDWPNRPRQIIDPRKGKASSTFYRVLETVSSNYTSRVELIPKTGRTHQLRVHMKFLGHAILGDELYASSEVANKSKRLLLHASEIEFSHPVYNSNVVFECPAPF